MKWVLIICHTLLYQSFIPMHVSLHHKYCWHIPSSTPWERSKNKEVCTDLLCYSQLPTLGNKRRQRQQCKQWPTTISGKCCGLFSPSPIRTGATEHISNSMLYYLPWVLPNSVGEIKGMYHSQYLQAYSLIYLLL